MTSLQNIYFLVNCSFKCYTFYTHAERDPDMFEMRVTPGYWVSSVVAVKHSVSNELSSWKARPCELADSSSGLGSRFLDEVGIEGDGLRADAWYLIITEVLRGWSYGAHQHWERPPTLQLELYGHSAWLIIWWEWKPWPAGINEQTLSCKNTSAASSDSFMR